MKSEEQRLMELSDRELIEILFQRVSELERFLLTFRQSQLIMLSASERTLRLPASVRKRSR